MRILLLFLCLALPVYAIETATFWQAPTYTQALKMIDNLAASLPKDATDEEIATTEGEIYGIVMCLPTLQNDGMGFVKSGQAQENEIIDILREANLLFTLIGPNPPEGFYTNFVEGEISGIYLVGDMINGWPGVTERVPL